MHERVLDRFDENEPRLLAGFWERVSPARPRSEYDPAVKIGIVVPFSWSFWGAVVEHAELQAEALEAPGTRCGW